MKRREIVYLASPFKALECKESCRGDFARHIAKLECVKLKAYGYIPISPVLLLSEIYHDEIDREVIMESCLELLERCDYIYVADHRDSTKSQGIKAELEHAKKLGILELSLF